MNQKQAMIAGILTGIGASLCCVVPLLFVGLGMGGAWLANLILLEPLRPLFIIATLGFIGFAFYQLYLTPKDCEPSKPCANEETQLKQRTIFWLVTVPLLGLLAFPWFAPLFY
ncbi:MAG: mercury transporter MerT [Nitrosomonas sp.]|nr:mercury transporter MerT [Nitrosomonas sp.]